jgi:hypothetical protein
LNICGQKKETGGDGKKRARHTNLTVGGEEAFGMTNMDNLGTDMGFSFEGLMF